ncbi:hypothetical protein D3C86_1464450 [compost metagenome]
MNSRVWVLARSAASWGVLAVAEIRIMSVWPTFSTSRRLASFSGVVARLSLEEVRSSTERLWSISVRLPIRAPALNQSMAVPLTDWPEAMPVLMVVVALKVLGARAESTPTARSVARTMERMSGQRRLRMLESASHRRPSLAPGGGLANSS